MDLSRPPAAVDSMPWFKMAPWIASRSYRVGTGEARAAISNERRHEFLVLENESAELWSRMEKGLSREELDALADDLGVSESLPEFLYAMAEAELLAGLVPLEAAANLSALTPAPSKLMQDAANTNAEHEMMQWVADRGYLFHAFWEVTFRCNESCVHCWNPGAAHLPGEMPHRQTDELSTHEAYRLLDELAEVGVFRLTLTGGELFLRSDAFEIIAHARALGMSVDLFTNGLLLSPAVIERLAHLWPTSIGISIYSANPDVHDEITRVPGSFIKSSVALKRLRDRGIKTYMKSIQMQHTIRAYQKVSDLADELGAAPQLELQMSTGVDGADAPNRLAAQDPSELIVLAATPGSPIHVGTAETDFGYAKKDMQSTVCGAGIGTMSIDPTGGIVPCASLPIATGDFRTHGFKAIWEQSTVGARRKVTGLDCPAITPRSESAISDKAAILNSWQRITLKDYHECGTHDRCGWCSKCPGLAMLEHGDALAPSTVNCRLAAAKMEAARFLKAGVSLAEIRAILGVPDTFGREDTRRPLVLIPNDDRRPEFDPKASGTAHFLAQTAGSGCGNCGGGTCGSGVASPLRKPTVAFDGGPGLELLTGSSETVAALRGFADLRRRYLAKIPS